MEEFRLFTLKGMADELKYPPENKQPCRVRPQEMKKDAGHKKRQRYQDQGNAKRMAQTVDWVLMAACILRNPLFIRASA